MRPFTEKQIQLGRLISRGLTYEEIAVELGVSASAVKQRTDRLRWVLGVEKKRQIPEAMRELGLLDR